MGIGARGMFGWAVGGGLVPGFGGQRRRRSRSSGLPVFGSGEIEGRGLVEVELGLGRAASGGHLGRPMGQVEVEEHVLHGGRGG